MKRLVDRGALQLPALRGASPDAFIIADEVIRAFEGGVNPPIDGLCIRPPFPKTWVEFRVRRSTRDYWAEFGSLVLEEGKQLKAILCIASQNHTNPSSLYRFDINVDKDWAIVDHVAHRLEPIKQDKKGEDQFVVMLCTALALMNCKNVELVDRVPDKKVTLKRKKKGKPSTIFKVLTVRPISRRHKDSTGGLGEPTRLHVSRGHFKDYREKGLFGRHKGVYWWQPHLRGDADRGKVEKIYKIQP